MSKRFGVWIAVLAVVLLGVGCGGGESDAPTVTEVSFDPSVTPAQYRQQANAICNEAKTEWLIALQKLAKEERGSVSQIPPEAQTAALLKTMRNALEKINGVAAPAKDREPVEGFVNTFQESVESIEQEELDTTQKIEPVFLRIANAATAYGLTGCEFG